MVAIGSIGYFEDHVVRDDSGYHYHDKDNVLFFIGVAATAASVSLLFQLVFFLGLHKKIDVFNWARTVRKHTMMMTVMHE